MIPRTPAAALHGQHEFFQKAKYVRDDSSCAVRRVQGGQVPREHKSGEKKMVKNEDKKQREAIALHKIEYTPLNMFLWTRPTLVQLKSHREDELPKTWNK
ncbi:hypothetical protein CDAR_105851 [Caerostris darwini]|uniref:Uncharacterized protein n=1 Tax=Caerostris darwini TaxID=1538125 RepID=A0AAV4TTS2_9ARAC|nr:hypothetical protein CDAR_105851 [Caerostris darwini]